MENLELEKKELENLMETPFLYRVKYKYRRPAKGLKGYFGRYEVVEGLREFAIKPPTLAVLDRLSHISIDFEQIFQKLAEAENAVELVKGIPAEMSYKLALYIAIATMGTDYYITFIDRSGRSRQTHDDEGLKDLAEFLFKWLVAEELVKLANVIFSRLGLENFINSMRLLKGTRTAAPKKKDLIE